MQISGRAWVFGDGINTDLIFPQVCFRLPLEERPKMAMHANRPDWAVQVRLGDLLVAGTDFGIGSSRPAADNLRGLGIAAVLAESINGLFFRNAANNGLPALAVRGIHGAVVEGETIWADFATGIVRVHDRELHGRPLPSFLLDIIRDGGLVPRLQRLGYID